MAVTIVYEVTGKRRIEGLCSFDHGLCDYGGILLHEK